jgi:hypothetical protein
MGALNRKKDRSHCSGSRENQFFGGLSADIHLAFFA